MDWRHVCQIFTTHSWPNFLKEGGGWGLDAQDHKEISLVVLVMFRYTGFGDHIPFLPEASRSEASLKEPNSLTEASV